MGNELASTRPDAAAEGAHDRAKGWPDPGQVTIADMNAKQRVRLVPFMLVVLSLVCSIAGPNADWYLVGHSVALVVALAVPVSYWWLSRTVGPHFETQRLALTAGLSLLAVTLVFAEAVMLSYGSADGALGDIGGTFLWLIGGVGLLGLSVLSAFLWPRKES